MNFEDIPKELNNICYKELGIDIHHIFSRCILFTPRRIITQNMKDLIVKCFAIASIPNFNKKDLNYIERELIYAGFFLERVNYQLVTSNSTYNNKWFNTTHDVWKAIGKGKIGDVYSVYDIKGEIVSDFIPL